MVHVSNCTRNQRKIPPKKEDTENVQEICASMGSYQALQARRGKNQATESGKGSIKIQIQ